MGRTGGDRLRGRATGRRAGRPERAPTGGVRGDLGPTGRGGLGGGGRAVRAGRDGTTWSSRAGRDAAGRARPSDDPRGHRRQGPRAPSPADPRRAAAAPRGLGRRGG